MRLKYRVLAVALLLLSQQTLARDLSTLQSALKFAQDELKTAETTRDADAKQVAANEMELENLKKQLEIRRVKAAQSQKQYLELKKRHAKAQADLELAVKQ